MRGEWERYFSVGNSNTGDEDADLFSVNLIFKFQAKPYALERPGSSRAFFRLYWAPSKGSIEPTSQGSRALSGEA
jgi:hypothetical protein